MGILTRVASIGWRLVKATPKLVFGVDSEPIGKAMKTAYKGVTKGSIFTKTKEAAKAGLGILESGPTGKAFYKQLAKDTITLPKFLAKGIKDGYKLAKSEGKNRIWGSLKGLGKNALKRMPLVNALVTLGFSIPDMIEGGKKEGATGVAKEGGKALAKLVGGSIGAAIGAALPIPGGAFFGYWAGEWLTSLVVGKSITEKEAEEKEEAQNKPKPVEYNEEQIKELKQAGLTDEEIQAAQQMGMTPEYIKEMIEKEKAEGAEKTDNTRVDKPEPQGQTQQKSDTTQAKTTQADTAQQQTTQTTTNPMTSIDYMSIIRSLYGGINPYSYQSMMFNPMLNLGYNSSAFYPQTFGMMYPQTFGMYTNPMIQPMNYMYPGQFFQYTV